MNNVAQRYAEALFELASEKNKVDLWQEQMDVVGESIGSNPRILEILKHSKIDSKDKKDILEKCFSSLDRPVYNFLRLLVDKGRFNYILEITTCFHRLCNESKNIVEGIVYSPYALSEEEVTMIEKAVGSKMNRTVELKQKLDSTLILGIKVVIDGKVYDGSMKNRVENLRTSLLKESR